MSERDPKIVRAGIEIADRMVGHLDNVDAPTAMTAIEALANGVIGTYPMRQRMTVIETLASNLREAVTRIN